MSYTKCQLLDVPVVAQMEFRAYMLGFARASHSLTLSALRAEGLRYIEEEREDLEDKPFNQVVKLVNVVANEIFEERF